MSVLPIYTYGTPVLRKRAKAVTAVTDDVVKLVMDMFDTMHAASGIGLAATQVGSLLRVVVIDVSDVEEMKGVMPLTLINPEVLSREGSWIMEEGCLSIPAVRDEVERSDLIRVRCKDTLFKDVELEAAGLLGRVILHEIDHLDGVLFIDHIANERKKLHRKVLKEIQRGEMEVNYPVVTSDSVSV